MSANVGRGQGLKEYFWPVASSTRIEATEPSLPAAAMVGIAPSGSHFSGYFLPT